MKLKIIFISMAVLFGTGNLFADSNYKAYKEYIKGILEFKSGKVAEATKDFERVVSLDSSAVSVYKELSYLYLQSGDKERAFKAADQIYELDGKSSTTTVFLGRFYSDAADQEKAKKYWEETLKLDPDNETAMIYMAVYYFSDDQLKKSAQYWDKYLKQQPDSAAGYMQLGLVQERLGKTKEALKTFDKVISLQPDLLDVYTSKARIYESMGNFELAKKEYEKYISLNPENPYILVFLGRAYFETKDYAKAIETFEAAKSFPQLDAKKTAYYWLGVTYEILWQLDNAIQEFEQLAKIEQNIAIYGKLGYYYSLKRDYSKAEKHLKKALSLEPLNYEALYLTALNYLDWGKYDKAIDYLNKTIEQKPDFVDAYFFLGSAYDKKKDFLKMEASFLKALEINPDHTKTLNYLAYSYIDKGINLENAEKYISRAVKLEPQNGTFLDSLGWLYYKQGKLELAAETLLKASNFTRDALIYEHLGDVYIALGKGSESWVAYALSYDIKTDVQIRKKLDAIEKIMPKEEFFRQIIFRSESNYLKIFSLKGGYSAKLSSGFFSSKAYIPFYFVRDEGIRIEIPQKFVMGGADIYIKNGVVSYSPKAIEDSIPADFNEIVDFISEIVSKDFLRQFVAGAVAEQKDKKITYKKDRYELVINSDTALIEKITKDDMSIELSEYTDFMASKLPVKIKITSKKLNINGTFEASKFQIAEKNSVIKKK